MRKNMFSFEEKIIRFASVRRVAQNIRGLPMMLVVIDCAFASVRKEKCTLSLDIEERNTDLLSFG